MLLVFAKTMILDTGAADGRALLALDVPTGLKVAMCGLVLQVAIVLAWEGFHEHASLKVANYVYYAYVTVCVIVLVGLSLGVRLGPAASDEGGDEQAEHDDAVRRALKILPRQ